MQADDELDDSQWFGGDMVDPDKDKDKKEEDEEAEPKLVFADQMPGGLLAVNNQEVKDIYDDYVFRNNTIERQIGEENTYYNNNSASR